MKRISILLTTGLLLSACFIQEESPEDEKSKDQVIEDVTDVTEQETEEDEGQESTDLNTGEDLEDEESEPSEPQEPELSREEILIADLPDHVSTEDWNLSLINPWHALPESFIPELTEVDNQQYIDSRIVDTWNAWKEAALASGHRLFFASGYRNIELQANNFNNTYQSYLNQGYSEEEALNKTKEYLTEPGHSEHHTGLAMDIVDEEWIVAGRGLETAYETQASQQWLVENMTDYGFVLRYPLGKEEITGIQYEPWHFRYVGQENAKFMVKYDLVLEEYIDLLKLRNESK